MQFLTAVTSHTVYDLGWRTMRFRARKERSVQPGTFRSLPPVVACPSSWLRRRLWRRTYWPRRRW